MAYHLSVVEIIHEINQQDTPTLSETPYTRNEHNSLSKSARSTQGADDLARLYSRIARSKRLLKAKKADVAAIAAAWGITGESELTLVQAIAQKAGALRVLSHTLRQAWLMASGDAQAQLGEKYIKAAFRDVYTDTDLLPARG